VFILLIVEAIVASNCVFEPMAIVILSGMATKYQRMQRGIIEFAIEGNNH